MLAHKVSIFEVLDTHIDKHNIVPTCFHASYIFTSNLVYLNQYKSGPTGDENLEVMEMLGFGISNDKIEKLLDQHEA